jgi:hypothetical protein
LQDLLVVGQQAPKERVLGGRRGRAVQVA